MTVGQLDSFIRSRWNHYIHLLTRAAVKFRKERLILGPERNKLDSEIELEDRTPTKSQQPLSTSL